MCTLSGRVSLEWFADVRLHWAASGLQAALTLTLIGQAGDAVLDTLDLSCRG